MAAAASSSSQPQSSSSDRSRAAITTNASASASATASATAGTQSQSGTSSSSSAAAAAASPSRLLFASRDDGTNTMEHERHPPLVGEGVESKGPGGPASYDMDGPGPPSPFSPEFYADDDGDNNNDRLAQEAHNELMDELSNFGRYLSKTVKELDFIDAFAISPPPADIDENATKFLDEQLAVIECATLELSQLEHTYSSIIDELRCV